MTGAITHQIITHATLDNIINNIWYPVITAIILLILNSLISKEDIRMVARKIFRYTLKDMFFMVGFLIALLTGLLGVFIDFGKNYTNISDGIVSIALMSFFYIQIEKLNKRIEFLESKI